MKIVLDGLELHNFKGIASFAFAPGGKDATIRGDNATGKTTVADAFQWLLFGKDSQGKSDFAIKTLDESGQELHGLDHSVEAGLIVDGQPITLKKVFREKWTKKRNSSNSTLTGHTTDHYIDGVPVKKREYEERISSIIDESTFKLLTSPTYFNTQLHWQQRRQILLQVCGDIEDQDVIASNQDLAKLPEILGDRSLEDHKKVVAAKKKEINKRLQEIPARIDELSRSIQAADQYSPKLIKDQIKELEGKIESAKVSNGRADLYRQKSELQAELSRLQHEDEQALRERTQAIQGEIDQLTRERREAAHEVQSIGAQRAGIKYDCDQWNAQIENLRVEFRDLAAQEANIDGTCPTCGQDLPEDQVQAAKDKFNQDKATRLKEINAKGKRIRENVDQATQRIEELSVKTNELESRIAELDQQIEAKEADLKQAKQQPAPNAERIAEIKTEIQKLDDQLTQTTQPDTSDLERELEANRTMLAEIEAAKKSKARIEELKEEEKQLAKEYEDLEQQTYLMDQFVVSKVNMLEDKINSSFALVRFKLFEEQINGGIQETCITTVDGVPYGSGLNRGAEINAGLDIIRTLSRHYGITAPVWIDNSEAVTQLLPLESQTIKMEVSKDYPEMEVMYHEGDASKVWIANS